MAGHEKLPGYQPDQQSIEPQLPASEIGERAHQLMEDFKQALKTTPEFLQKLSDQFFTPQPYRELLEEDDRFDSVDFMKGDSQFVVRYENEYFKKTGNGRESLYVGRSSLIPKSQDERWYEQVSLESYTTGKSKQFVEGTIRVAKGTKFTEGVDIPKNTQSAILEAQEFLVSSFGEHQSQPPPKK
jgi:hypothetical protein